MSALDALIARVEADKLDADVERERIRLGAAIVVARRSAEYEVRCAAFDDAYADLEAARDHALWMRWRMKLAEARLVRAMKMLARVRDLCG